MSEQDGGSRESEPGDTAPKSVSDASESERDESERDESERDESERDEPARAEPERRAAKAGRARSAAKGRPAGGNVAARTALVAVVGLAAGLAAGWFGHEARAKAKLRAESAPAAAGSGAARGPCGAWEQKICAGGGTESAACQQAKVAADLLTPSTCEAALEAVPATLAKVKAARVPCDNLSTKLCAEVPQGSGTCGMVKQRLESMPGDRCQDMLKNYDQVAMQIRMIEQQTGGNMMGGPHGPSGAMRGHGAPPGAMPPRTPQPGAPGSPPAGHP